MFAKPQAEHDWYKQLLGSWEFEHECNAGPEMPAAKVQGKLRATSMGGLWVLLDCSSDQPDGSSWTSQFTLGYDPVRGKFVGTFIASMMTHLWIYEGQLDPDGRTLVMDVEGPRFDGNGMAHYQDCFEVVSPDHWILRSRIKGDDGQWVQFMEGHHRRVG